jgi:hypothetical protein
MGYRGVWDMEVYDRGIRWVCECTRYQLMYECMRVCVCVSTHTLTHSHTHARCALSYLILPYRTLGTLGAILPHNLIYPTVLTCPGSACAMWVSHTDRLCQRWRRTG